MRSWAVYRAAFANNHTCRVASPGRSSRRRGSCCRQPRRPCGRHRARAGRPRSCRRRSRGRGARTRRPPLGSLRSAPADNRRRATRGRCTRRRSQRLKAGSSSTPRTNRETRRPKKRSPSHSPKPLMSERREAPRCLVGHAREARESELTEPVKAQRLSRRRTLEPATHRSRRRADYDSARRLLHLRLRT